MITVKIDTSKQGVPPIALQINGETYARITAKEARDAARALMTAANLADPPNSAHE